jgi:hypothetical protein
MYKLMFAVCLFGACTMETASERLDGKTVEDELCATGCSAEVEEALATPRKWEEVGDKLFVSTDDQKLFDDPCAQLPAEGICAFVCDPDELIKHIPAGTCLDVRCELRDGREILAGACAAP